MQSFAKKKRKERKPSRVKKKIKMIAGTYCNTVCKHAFLNGKRAGRRRSAFHSEQADYNYPFGFAIAIQPCRSLSPPRLALGIINRRPKTEPN
jgi:hypothetical protein